MALIEPQDELQALLDRETPKVAEAMLRLIPWLAERLRSRAPISNVELARRKDFEDFRRLLEQTMILSDLLGRRRLLLEAEAARRGEAKLAGTFVSPFVPRVRFEEAVDDIADRHPEIRIGFEEVQRLYREQHGFAVARSATLELTNKVQDEIEKGIREGRTGFETVQAIEKSIKGEPDPFVTTDTWTRAYVQTVYRTNAATAYTAGRFQQALDPDVSAVIGALEFTTAGDSAVRPTHAALDGVIMAQDDPRWNFIAPPIGYNCRCVTRLVTRDELEEKGLIQNGRVVSDLADWDGSAPDPDFRSRRPDRQIYG